MKRDSKMIVIGKMTRMHPPSPSNRESERTVGLFCSICWASLPDSLILYLCEVSDSQNL